MSTPSHAERTMQVAWRSEYRAKTPEGRYRIHIALFKHGRYSRQAKQDRREWRELLRNSADLLSKLTQPTQKETIK